MILDQIGNDKPTLAKCMGATLQLSTLVAPRLYTVIHWKRDRPFPLRPTIRAKTTSRLPSNKHYDLIKICHLRDHDPQECAGAMSGNGYNLILPVPVLLYSVQSNYDSYQGLHQRACNVTHKSRPSCRLLQTLAPKTVVLEDARYYEPIPLSLIDPQQLSKIVVRIDLSHTGRAYPRPTSQLPRRPFGRSPARSKSVVFIINGFQDNDFDAGTADEENGFCAILAKQLYKPNFASLVLLVNATGLITARNGSIHSRQRADISGLQFPLHSRADLQLSELRHHWSSERKVARPWKTLGEAQAMQIKFIDIQEYLREYDTSGEFTEEERAVWQSVRPAYE